MRRDNTERISHHHDEEMTDVEHHELYPEYKDGKISSRSNDESEVDDELLYEMEEYLETEIKGISHFSKLAMKAETEGHPDIAYTFYEIAKEKLECAEFIRLRLIELDHYEPLRQKNIEERFDRAKHLFRRL